MRAHAQKDPLIEYKKEAFAAFQEMNMWIQEETVEKLLKIRLVNQERAREVVQARQEIDQSSLSYAGADESLSAFEGRAPAPAGQPVRGGLPFARPQSPQNMNYGPPDGDDDGGPRMNREQRRQMKKEKKKKLKF